jgi:hypothetical protein
MTNADIEQERRLFREYLLSNPNYFGTNPASKQEPVLKINNNTKYEEIGCVGFDPKFSLLEAVVFVNEAYGYGGTICQEGTPQYVRFYLSFDRGETWEDQGLTSFRAYNIPERSQRLEYAVTLETDALREFCSLSRPVLCRAILSWNNPPTPDTPAFIPVWGDVHDTWVFPTPTRLTILPDLFEAYEVKAPQALLDQLPDAETISLKKTPSLSAIEQLKMIQEGELKVDPSRAAYPAMHSLLKGGSQMSITDALAQSELAGLDELKIDIDQLLKPFAGKDGNTTYEELECVGLSPGEEYLVGTLRIKRPNGFSGGPCTEGSSQYVAFWADLNGNGTYETHLGTADIRVFDVNDIPDGGLEYSVTLPVDFSAERRPCEEGARLIPIRAILSWNTPPDPSDPEFVPAWGNREDTLVQVRPGRSVQAPGAYFTALGGIAEEQINDVTGETVPGAQFVLNALSVDEENRPCRFGGRVVINGNQFPGYTYRIDVQEAGTTAWTPLTRSLKVLQSDGTLADHTPDTSDGLFSFLGHANNTLNVLGYWDTSGDGEWTVRLRVFDASGTTLIGAETQRLHIKNSRPTVDLEITTGAGDCDKFAKGTTVEGRFVALDDNFGHFTLGVLPGNSGGTVNPPRRTTPTAPAGETWRLQTNSMDPCGYVLRVRAEDRTIINSARVGWAAATSVGFCLDA